MLKDIEEWASTQRGRSLAILDHMWADPPGHFCRELGQWEVKFAFTNYGVSLGLQAVGAHEDRVQRLNAFFDTYRSGDEYDTSAITHVMACTSRFPGVAVARESRDDGTSTSPASSPQVTKLPP